MIILHCFFLFRVVFNSFFTIPEVTENAKLKLSSAIHIGAQETVANEAIDFHHLLQIKKLRSYQNR